MRDKDYSESTAIAIDQEVHRIVEECYQKAKTTLEENIDKLKKLSERLLEKEVLDSEEVKQIVGLNGQVSPSHSKAEPKQSEKS